LATGPDPLSTGPDLATASVAQAEDRLARLQVQVESMRAVLVRMLQDVVLAESRLARTDAAKIAEVNERLVVAAMASQDDADTAAMALEDAQSSAMIDALTQLPTRAALAAQFAPAMAHARRHRSRLALLFLDLDDFKRLNDSHGHAFGDQLLRLAAARMKAAVREVDTVSRQGGDEFLVLLADLAQARDAQAVAEKLLAALAAPLEIDGQAVRLAGSIGIALYPDDGDDLDGLVRLADAAMYQSKRRGTGAITFHGEVPGEERAPPAAPASGAAAPDPERRQALLREANEKLVLAALDAQELKAAAEQTQQRQAALMAAVADELRNPMAPIRIAAAMLGSPGASEPLLPRVQGLVEQQLAQMSRLVGNLADAASVGGGGGGLQFEFGPVDMAAVVAGCVAKLQPTLDRRGQTLALQLPPGVLEVRGDAPQLAHAVGNLLDNASKYSYDGGSMGLAVVAGTDSLTLTVSDQGIGITPQMLTHIFEPFVQDTHAIGFNGTGLGIGLTIAQALVRAHHGTLVAHSAGIGRGSRFVVTLPRAAAAPAGPAPATGAAGGQG
jgi:diguanylate cyclase (GGDEF)-like protein